MVAPARRDSGGVWREAEATPRGIAWLFPVSYALHLVEELVAGGGFSAWAEHSLDIHLSEADFLTWNAAGLALMCAGAVLISSHCRFRPIEIMMSIAVLGNAVTHVIASLVTWTYSPGLVTGVLIWLPLGIVRLRAAYRDSSRAGRVAGVWLGVLVTAVVLTVLALAAESVDQHVR